MRWLVFSRLKAPAVRETQGRPGELIVLTDGDKQVTLEPRALDLEEDSPELAAEHSRAVNRLHPPFSKGELRELANRALREH